MKEEEVWTKEFLIHRGFKEEDITFEPNGQDTFPDFLVEGKSRKIGVETRRLNKYFQNFSGREPIEKLAKNIERVMTELLASFGSSTDGVSWYVNYDFKRP
jgi:hypothetical protein